MKTQFIKWTYNGEEKMVALELGEECEIKETMPVIKHKIVAKAEDVGEVEQVIQEVKEVKKKSGCTSCEQSKNKRGLMGLIKGSAGLLKAELGIDAADDATIEKRKAICLACGTYDFGVCNDCGCFTAAKVKLKTGSPCPQQRW
jgi:hypothetical protein